MPTVASCSSNPPRRGWELPGGQVEENESLPDALIREVVEESGFTISVGSLAGIYTARPRSLLIHTFVGTKLSGVAKPSTESLDVGWFPLAEARRLIEWPSMRLRLDDLAAFSGTIVYRIYANDPFAVLSR